MPEEYTIFYMLNKRIADTLSAIFLFSIELLLLKKTKFLEFVFYIIFYWLKISTLRIRNVETDLIVQSETYGQCSYRSNAFAMDILKKAQNIFKN